MQNYRLGNYIRQRRQELNLTQEQVCAGICEPVTLSRFENGRQTPSRTRINAILQRLGLPDDRYYALVTPEELEIEALEKEIVACNALKHVNEGFDKIGQLEKIVKPDDQIAQQFILRSKVLLGGLDKRYSSDERIQMLMQAVQMTIPNFQLSKIEDYLYTLDEMKLVNQIGNAYSLAGDNEKAADIFYRLLQYMRRHLQEMVTSNRMLPLVLYNFADLWTCWKDMKKAQKLQEMEKKLALNMDIIKCFTLVWKSKLSVIFSLAKKKRVPSDIVRLLHLQSYGIRG